MYHAADVGAVNVETANGSVVGASTSDNDSVSVLDESVNIFSESTGLGDEFELNVSDMLRKKMKFADDLQNHSSSNGEVDGECCTMYTVYEKHLDDLTPSIRKAFKHMEEVQTSIPGTILEKINQIFGAFKALVGIVNLYVANACVISVFWLRVWPLLVSNK
jgi:hypothetical protein